MDGKDARQRGKRQRLLSTAHHSATGGKGEVVNKACATAGKQVNISKPIEPAWISIAASSVVYRRWVVSFECNNLRVNWGKVNFLILFNCPPFGTNASIEKIGDAALLKINGMPSPWWRSGKTFDPQTGRWSAFRVWAYAFD